MPIISSEQFPDAVEESCTQVQGIHEVRGATPDFRSRLAAQLAELIPEAVADGKVDIEKLRELLAEDAVEGSERFGLFWPGKKRALRAAQAPTTATLKPDFANSKEWDTTQNVFIEGDNLEVLKILQKHYHNKIKLIYIDPPYNTGKDFVYPDNFTEGVQTYLEWTKQVNQKGKLVSSNKETSGRYHSNWLNMMYPRVKLARNLLTDDGVIFISIDDNEIDNLRKLCNEVFGEGNFIVQILWKKRSTPPNDKIIGANHDYILCYSKKSGSVKINLRDRTQEQVSRYQNPDNHPKGPWVAGDLMANVKGGRFVKSLYFAIKNPKTGEEHFPGKNGNWRFSAATISDLIENNEISFGEDGTGRPKLKRFLCDVKEGVTYPSIWDFVPLNTTGSGEMNELFGNSTVFENPKPSGLLAELVKLGAVEDGLVLDFFAGSSTTAHAVMKLNAEDGGQRRFIMVQLPEPTPEASEARKAGFANIADISRKRIELAGEKIKADSPLTTQNFDAGFRAYKLADTNFAKWHMESSITPDKLEEALKLFKDSAADDAAVDELLTELLLKMGFPLTAKIDNAEIAGLEVRWVSSEAGGKGVLAYLNEHIKPTQEQLHALVAAEPVRLIVLEDAFDGDDELKTNLAQQCKSRNVELWTA